MNAEFDFDWDTPVADDLSVPTPPAAEPSDPPADPAAEGDTDDFFNLDNDGTPADPDADPTPPAEDPTEDPSEEEPAEPEVVDIIGKLKELGIIPEDSDVTQDILPEFLDSNFEQDVESAVIETLNGWKDSLSDDGAKFVEFSRNGGTLEDFMKTHIDTPLHTFDMNSELGQEAFLRYYLSKEEGKTTEEVDDIVEYYMERENIEKASKASFTRLQTKRDGQVKQLLDQRSKQQKESRRLQEERKTELKKSLKDVTETSGYNFSASEKTLLSRYITKPSVKVGDQYVSEFFHKIQSIYNSDPAKLLMLAKLAKNDFDMSFLERTAESKVTKGAKEVINKPSTKSRAAKPKVIWEY